VHEEGSKRKKTKPHEERGEERRRARYSSEGGKMRANSSVTSDGKVRAKKQEVKDTTRHDGTNVEARTGRGHAE
jgi:hypothetical protein